MLYRLDSVIDTECLNNFLAAVNLLQPFEELTIYMKGDGGEAATGEALTSIINELTLTNTVRIIGYESLASAHFALFFECLAHEKIFLPSIKGLLHKTSWAVPMSEGGKPVNDSFAVFQLKFLQEIDSLKSLKKVIKLNKDEIKRFNNNEDVWMLPDRMMEHLEYNKTKTKAKPIKLPI